MEQAGIGDRTGAHRVGWVRVGFLVLAILATLHTLSFNISFASERSQHSYGYGYGSSQPAEPDTGTAYLAFFVLAALFGAAAAYTGLSAAKPPEQRSGVYTYYANTLGFGVRVFLEVLLDGVMVGMIWIGTASLFDSLLRPGGGVGIFIGPVCVLFGIWLIMWRPFTVIDTEKKVIKRSSFPLTTTLPFDQVAKLDIEEVIGRRGPAGWAVVAVPASGGKPLHIVKTGYSLEGALHEMSCICKATGIAPGRSPNAL